MEIIFSGIGVSAGIAIGQVCRMEFAATEPSTVPIKSQEIPKEKQRYHDAVALCVLQLQQMAQQLEGERKDLLLAHIAILQDPYLASLTMQNIENCCNAELALAKAVGSIAGQMEQLDDVIIRARVADLKDEGQRIARRMAGLAEQQLPQGSYVVIAKEIPPSSAVLMQPQSLLGLATEQGGPTAHAAILARSAEVPAIMAVDGNLFETAKNGQWAVVDGIDGRLVLNPSTATLADAKSRKEQFEAMQKELQSLKSLPAQTQDGHSINLLTNISAAHECASAIKNGAEGVGLFRTEFLFMQTEGFPSEELQYAAYQSAAAAMGAAPLTIRTLDIGGEKIPPYCSIQNEENPALGLRGIRFSLQNTEEFKSQLRAILRASAHGNVRVMFPMIASYSELCECMRLLCECKQELAEAGCAYNAHLPVGVMIETPAAAMLVDVFAADVDFFSIGTNDLTQYVLAADRAHPDMQYLYNELHPAVLKAVSMVVQAANSRGKEVCVCGEMASNPLAVPLLVGMGVSSLSVSSSSLAAVKQQIRSHNHNTLNQLAQKALICKTTQQVQQLM